MTSQQVVVGLNPGVGKTMDEAIAAIRHAIEHIWTYTNCTVGIGFLMLQEKKFARLVVHGGVVSLSHSILKNWNMCSRIEGLGYDGWCLFLEAVRHFLVDLERVYDNFDFGLATSEDL